MASRSDADVARLLNLNTADSDAFFEIVNGYFGPRNDLDVDEFSDADESDKDLDNFDGKVPSLDTEEQNSNTVVNEPVTTDLAEAIVSLLQRPDKPTKTATTKPDLPPASFCICTDNPCHLKFSPEDIEQCRLQYLALITEQRDIALLAKIEVGIHMESQMRKSKKSQQSIRQASRTDLHWDINVCRKFFRYLHCAGDDKITDMIKHYKENGVEPRVHGNTKKLRKNALEYKDTKAVVDFILNFATLHAIQLPDRTPKHWVSDVQLLPTDMNKATVYAQYKASMDAEPAGKTVSLRTFQRLWKSLVPFVCTMPPASDLCWTCQQLTYKIRSDCNKEDRMITSRELQEHLRIVKLERAYYQVICATVKQQLPADRPLGSYPACSFPGLHHVSFDFAQQVHYPSDPQQPGPIFFKTPRKCGLFRVNSEGCGVQVNYLIDEAHSTGKGGNVVISLMHDYLENHSLGETDLHLHADNCAGQKKNNQMLWYLMWRCLMQRNQSIRLSFLVAGHTKFSPDGGFGLIKRKYRLTKVDCLQDIVDVVNSSSAMNVGKLVGSENGPTQLPAYDWTKYFSQYFSRIKGIKSSHHFHFDGTGVIRIKENIEAEEVRLNVTKLFPPQNTMPDIVQAPSLSVQRQDYLYKEIRPFVAEDKRDIVTPLPREPVPEEIDSDGENEETVPVPPKRAKKNPRAQNQGRGGGRGVANTAPQQ
ncbi:hypothetical protein RRG08_026185 [Elysia crispata]|uniref:DUF7869 domain-containing protein n=1 Tax=Elysia crispata TaxID=231223 RepID=A0AAE0ZB66_9GAST|nr:hypothetical protein RRG08_026185 [Elysia crispata]